MHTRKLFSIVLTMIFSATIISCGPTMKTTGTWVNKEKIPPEPIKSVFIIAFTDNMEARSHFETALADAAAEKGIKAYKSIEVIGPVDIKYIAPVKDVFIKKLQALNCETIFTVALVNEESETRYVSSTTVTTYAPYSYVAYGGYGGYPAYGNYGGFGGYYGYAVNTMSSGYYKTDKKYFLEAKMFDLNTDELLLSIQSAADNPPAVEKAAKQYTLTLMDEIKNLQLRKK